MKRTVFLLIAALLLSLPLQIHAQGVFVSSDAAIVMNVPQGWSVVETAPQTVSAVSDAGVIVNMTYGAALGVTDDESLSIEERVMALPAITNGELFATELEILGQQMFRLYPLLGEDETPSESAPTRYLVNSTFSGLTQFEIYGSPEPVLDMLALYEGYDAPAAPPFDCAELTLERNSAIPGTQLTLQGLTYHVEDFFVQAVTPDEDGSLPVLTVPGITESVLIAPLHNSLSLEGGAATLQFVKDGEICHEIPFTIEALPPAPGEMARFVSSAQAYLDSMTRYLGITREDILDGDVPEDLLPLAFAQWYLDHPDNPDSLANVVANTPPENLVLMDAIFAQDEIVARVQGFSEILNGLDPLPAPETAGTAQFVSSELPFIAINEFSIATQVEIPDAETLAFYMFTQNEFELLAGAIGDTVGATADNVNATIGTAAAAVEAKAAAGSTSATVAQRTGLGAAVFGAASLTAATMLDLYRNLLPSDITDMHLRFTHVTIDDEDSTRRNYRLEKMWVTATSREWSVTKTVADIILTFVGTPGATGAGDAAKAARAAAARNGSQQVGRWVSAAEQAGNISAGAGAASQACANFSSCSNAGPLTIGPFEWRNVPFVFPEDNRFIDFEISLANVGDPSIEIYDETYYRPIDDGITVVDVRLDRTLFGNKEFIETAYLKVERINVYTEVPTYVEPNQRVCATATRVDYAETEDISWELERVSTGEIVAAEITGGLAPHEFCFTMPDPDDMRVTNPDVCTERERAAYLLTAEAITTTGARQYNSDEPRWSVKAIYTLDEQNLCDGLWQVTSLREDENFCDITPPVATPGGTFANLNFIIDQMYASYSLDSTVIIDAINGGDALEITDISTGRAAIASRIDGREGLSDLEVEILLEEEAERLGDARNEDWEQISEDEAILLRAPDGSTVWLDGQRYYSEFPIPPAGNGVRQTETLRVNTLFVAPDTFIAVLSWRFEGSVTSNNGVRYDFDCDIDFVSIGEYQSGEPEEADDEDAPVPEPDEPPEPPPPPPDDDEEDE